LSSKDKFGLITQINETSVHVAPEKVIGIFDMQKKVILNTTKHNISYSTVRNELCMLKCKQLQRKNYSNIGGYKGGDIGCKKLIEESGNIEMSTTTCKEEYGKKAKIVEDGDERGGNVDEWDAMADGTFRQRYPPV
jgi:hypothetical protein